MKLLSLFFQCLCCWITFTRRFPPSWEWEVQNQFSILPTYQALLCHSAFHRSLQQEGEFPANFCLKKLTQQSEYKNEMTAQKEDGYPPSVSGAFANTSKCWVDRCEMQNGQDFPEYWTDMRHFKKPRPKRKYWRFLGLTPC